MNIKIFSALWCPSCIIMRPRYEDILEKNKDIDAKFIDVDDEEDILKDYQIDKVLPVFILYNEEKEVLRIVGEKSKKELFNILEDYLNV